MLREWHTANGWRKGTDPDTQTRGSRRHCSDIQNPPPGARDDRYKNEGNVALQPLPNTETATNVADN